MDVSVVIPAFNEEKYLLPCLESLVNQKTRHSTEVLVVDNNSTDSTADVARKFSDRLNLKIISELKRGRGAARRTGFASARGEILLSTDADTRLPDNWIESMSAALGKEIQVITGSCDFYDVQGFRKYFLDRFQPWLMRFYKILFGNNLICGFNFGITRYAYDKSGGFDSELNALEDLDLTVKLSKYFDIKYIPDVKVSASARRFKRGVMGNIFSYLFTYFKFKYKRYSANMADVR